MTVVLMRRCGRSAPALVWRRHAIAPLPRRNQAVSRVRGGISNGRATSNCLGQARRVDSMNNPYRPWLESSMAGQVFRGGLAVMGL